MGMNPAAVGGAHALGARGPHATYTSVKAPKVHSDKSKSHVSPDAKNAPRLLFVADDGTNDVYIFTMPAMALKGTLTGLSEPQGMCSDKSGNIWITNTGTQQILQYSRTGTLLNTLSDSIGFPVGCAINKATGDLAVTNIFNTSGNGTVAVYPNATGTPTQYSNPSQSENFFDAYDGNGNLYVSGEGGAGYSLSVLPSGSSNMTTVSVSGGTLFFPGSVNWNKNAGLILGDQECNDAGASCLYAVTVSGSVATITGSTPLTNTDGGGCDVDQAVISPGGKYYGGGCISEGSAPSVAARWAYPAGGAPTNSTTTGISEPIGAAISNK
jgi:hypothetical protein